MSASQESCSALFECSCPELDALTALARRSGAYGSRLTGAGWGGCTVSLVAEDRVEEFIAKIKEGYAPYRELSEEKLRDAIFATKPSSGAFGESLSLFLICVGLGVRGLTGWGCDSAEAGRVNESGVEVKQLVRCAIYGVNYELMYALESIVFFVRLRCPDSLPGLSTACDAKSQSLTSEIPICVHL